MKQVQTALTSEQMRVLETANEVTYYFWKDANVPNSEKRFAPEYDADKQIISELCKIGYMLMGLTAAAITTTGRAKIS